ncbi:MAG: hypothetical protein ACEPO8_12005 [Rhodothermaceae bacterium]
MSENSVVPIGKSKMCESGQDPLTKMIEIVKDDGISNEDKEKLITIALNRFHNRRKMAYISLYTIVTSLIVVFIFAFIDGLIITNEESASEGIMTIIKNNQTLIIWIETFLTSIVAAYYGISAWKPSS